MARAQNSLLHDALTGLSDGVAIFDPDANLVLVNPAFRDMATGLREFLLPGTSWDIFLREAENRGLYTAETCKRLAVIEADLLTQPEDIHHVRAITASGSYLLRLNASSDGGFILTQAETQDETAREDADREMEMLLSKVLEACPTSITMSRVGDGQIIYRSPAATALLGTAKSHAAHFAKRADRADFITALLPDARVDDMRLCGIRADGQEFPASLSARLIEYRGEDVIVSAMEDLSSILSVQAELAHQRAQVFQAEKLSALGELLAGVAHELNNPLSIIVGNAEMLSEDLEDTPHAKRIEKLGAAAERCVRIVRSFLSMARQEALNPHPTQLATMFEAAKEANAALLDETGITLTLDLPGDMPSLMVDEVQITQVAINLLTNAIQAMRDAGQGDQITVTARRDPGGEMAELTVSDNGPGIAAEIAHRIFDPLFTTKEVGAGTGVGLAFCHRVIAAHGGAIELLHPGARGATFRIHLPLS